jgi:hypothetical protein
MAIEFTERFIMQYRKLPNPIQKKVDKSPALLDIDFRGAGLKSHPVHHAPGIFEAYVDDKYRMTYSRRGETLVMRNVDNHDDCLGNP